MAFFLVGIDEVGRGPLAGPVSLGIVVAPPTYDISYVLPEVNDSKAMTERARERVYRQALELRNNGALSFGVFSEPASLIDELGIEHAIRSCVEKGLKELLKEGDTAHVFLDGRLRAPKEYSQESIIRGDSVVPLISLASVVAKCERDEFMTTTLAKEYPEYGFEKHKGYGTEAHIQMIKKHGASPVHRRSFLSNVFGVTISVS